MATPISKGSLSPITAEIWQFLSPPSCPPCIMIFLLSSFFSCVFFFIPYHPPPFFWFQAPSRSRPVIQITTMESKKITIYIHFWFVSCEKAWVSKWWYLLEKSCRVAWQIQLQVFCVAWYQFLMLLLLWIPFWSQLHVFPCWIQSFYPTRYGSSFIIYTRLCCAGLLSLHTPGERSLYCALYAARLQIWVWRSHSGCHAGAWS